MKPQAHLHVAVARNRYFLGTATLFVARSDERVVAHAIGECLARADRGMASRHGNPNADPLRPYGHLPTGTYAVTLSTARRQPVRSYGPHPVLVLDPVAGDALTAKENGRWGLLVHGGALSTARTLRPTYGCLRFSNRAQALLVSLFDEFDITTCTVLEVDGSVIAGEGAA